MAEEELTAHLVGKDSDDSERMVNVGAALLSLSQTL
jgi:hypothetical protein